MIKHTALLCPSPQEHRFLNTSVFQRNNNPLAQWNGNQRRRQTKALKTNYLNEAEAQIQVLREDRGKKRSGVFISRKNGVNKYFAEQYVPSFLA